MTSPQERERIIDLRLEREAGEDTDHRCICGAIIPKHRDFCTRCGDEQQAYEDRWW